MKGIHGSLGPTWAKRLFSLCPCQLCGVDFCLPLLSPPFTHTDVLDEPKNYKYIHVSPTSPTWVLFTTLHCVHVSPTSLTWVLFSTLHRVHVSLTSPTWVLFSTLHRVHVSPTSPTWVLFTTLRINYNQNTNHTNGSLGMHNSVVLW